MRLRSIFRCNNPEIKDRLDVIQHCSRVLDAAAGLVKLDSNLDWLDLTIAEAGRAILSLHAKLADRERHQVLLAELAEFKAQ